MRIKPGLAGPPWLQAARTFADFQRYERQHRFARGVPVFNAEDWGEGRGLARDPDQGLCPWTPPKATAFGMRFIGV